MKFSTTFAAHDYLAQLINEDESGDSSQPDDDGSEDAESDEHSQEDFMLGDEQLERRPSSSAHTRNNLAPQSMQWAIRARDSTRSTNLHRLTGGGSNLVFIDPNALRRSTATNAAVAAAQENPTMATTSSSLARAFGIVLRQISELIGMVSYNLSCPSSGNYPSELNYQEAVQLQVNFNLFANFFREINLKILLDVCGKAIEANLGLDFNSDGRHGGTIKIWSFTDRFC